jgi:hypothetical protein
MMFAREEARSFLLAVAVGTLAIAMVELASPTALAPSALWNGWAPPLADALGSYGLAGFCVVLGLFCLFVSSRRDAH